MTDAAPSAPGGRTPEPRSALVDAELQALYSALPVGVAFLGPDLRYQRVNETLAKLNGRSVDAHVGATLEEVLGENAPALRDALQRVMETRQALEFQLTTPLPQDPADVRTLEATYFPVIDGGGQLLGVGATVRDVTDRLELELKESRLLQEALFSRAEAEAARVRTDDAREEAERTGAEAQRGRDRMALLAQAGRRMAESMDWEATLEAVVRSVIPGIADWASLTVVEPGGDLRVHAIAHRDPERERVARELFERHPPDTDRATGAGHVIRTGEMEVLTDITPDGIRAAARDADHLALLERLDPRQMVTAPLGSPRGVTGALSLVLDDSGRRFSDDDLQLIRSLATRAALHIENARLYTERSNIARTLQASLQPRPLPGIPGAELAATYLPAGDQNTVGGDFYEVFPTGEQTWAAVVGDVSGKGAPAAALTALARYSLRMTARMHDDPAANLALLNRAFYEDTQGYDFCSVVYARICPGEDGVDVRFANGGHLPPLLVRVDGSIEAIEGGRGTLVGAIADATFEEATLSLQPGEILLLYSDGVTEVRMSDVGLGERELRAALAAHAGGSAQELVTEIARRAVELQSGTPRDDIALLAIKAGEPAGSELR
ncbi:MAG TPA: SpoIIE family protein phosphatase [Solirubrobacteraceae bacterium]|nr:SpoIIE family protein phosphatase [Solirubrobacteraceae bacterium]